MPAWGMHLKTAKKLNEYLKLNEDKFYFGNVMVDAERHVVHDLSVVVSYDDSHYAKLQNVNGIMIKLPDYERFIEENYQNLSNPVVLGYLTHLMTDFYYNRLTFGQKFLSDGMGKSIGIKLNNGTDKICDKETIRILKQTDFDTYSRELYSKEDVLIDENKKDDILKACKDIKNIKYNGEDVLKIINFVNNIKNNYDKRKDEKICYKVFTKEEFDYNFNKCVEFILDNLKSHKIIE